MSTRRTEFAAVGLTYRKIAESLIEELISTDVSQCWQVHFSVETTRVRSVSALTSAVR